MADTGTAETIEKKLEKWAKSFKVIGHPIRLASIFILYGSDVLRGKGSLRFNEIGEILGLPPESNLAHHLKELIKVGFVEKTPSKDEKGEVFPLYHITERGKEFLGDFGLLEPLRQYVLSKKT